MFTYIYCTIKINHSCSKFMPYTDPMGMFFSCKIIGDSTHLFTSKHVTRKTCSGYILELFLGFDFSFLRGVSIHNSSPWFFGTIFRWTSQTASLPSETRPFDPKIIFQSIDFQQHFFVRFWGEHKVELPRNVLLMVQKSGDHHLGCIYPKNPDPCLEWN